MKPNNDLCQVYSVDQQKVQRLQGKLGAVEGLSEMFKALADDTRLKIVYCLSQEELCGCDLAETLGLSTATISHHLRTLRQLKLVRPRRAGKLVYYSLTDTHVEHIIMESISHWEEDK